MNPGDVIHSWGQAATPGDRHQILRTGTNPLGWALNTWAGHGAPSAPDGARREQDGEPVEQVVAVAAEASARRVPRARARLGH